MVHITSVHVCLNICMSVYMYVYVCGHLPVCVHSPVYMCVYACIAPMCVHKGMNIISFFLHRHRFGYRNKNFNHNKECDEAENYELIKHCEICKMNVQVKVLAAQAWWPQLDPKNTRKCRGETLHEVVLASTHVAWITCTHTHISCTIINE